MGYKHRTIKQFNSFRHKKKDVKPGYLLPVSRSEAPENCPVCRNEQRRKPHADMLRYAQRTIRTLAYGYTNCYTA